MKNIILTFVLALIVSLTSITYWEKTQSYRSGYNDELTRHINNIFTMMDTCNNSIVASRKTEEWATQNRYGYSFSASAFFSPTKKRDSILFNCADQTVSDYRWMYTK